MYIKKKTALIVSLICLLVVVGYVNHELTKRSLMQSSSDYQQHEENQLMELSKTIADDTVEISLEDLSTNEEVEIVDSKNDTIKDLRMVTEDNIESVITKEESLNSNNYFIEHRLSRDKLRATLIDRLYEIINNENTNEDIRTKAQNEIIELGQVAELELNIEGLIKAKGFEDALVFLGDNSARVVVSVDELTEQDVVKIYEIIKSEANIETTNIKIMKKL
ncbi:SpoIIIAH-like family protein [Proteiniborus sp.]|uniref:SpoIIIAH-like family protein n=1 Tax=Proteiniborus sp. TaxID=2079015 RepID=UPI0033214BA9